MIQLNDNCCECLTRESVMELLEACKKGNPPPMGRWGSLPMNGQVSCEGPKGKTSLTWKEVQKTRFEKGEVDPASVKEDMSY